MCDIYLITLLFMLLNAILVIGMYNYVDNHAWIRRMCEVSRASFTARMWTVLQWICVCKLITREEGGRSRGWGEGGGMLLRICGCARRSTNKPNWPTISSGPRFRRLIREKLCATRFIHLLSFHFFMPFDRDRYRISPSRSRIRKLRTGAWSLSRTLLSIFFNNDLDPS